MHTTCRSRGRRSLLWAVALYAVVMVAINGAVDGWWPELRSPYLVDTFHQLQTCPEGRADVVCVGTSRLAMAFCADVVQGQLLPWTADGRVEVFNASAGSQDLITADFIMERLLARGPAVAGDHRGGAGDARPP